MERINNNIDRNEFDFIYEIVNSSDSIIKNGYNISLATQYLILGELTYDVLLYNVIFSNITQNIKVIGTIINHLSPQNVLNTFINYCFASLKIWESTSYGIKEKLRISYKIIGYCLHHKSYNFLYSIFRESLEDYLIKIAYSPTIDYEKAVTQILGSIHFKVSCVNDYSERDKEYQAVTTINGRTLKNINASKTQAVKELYMIVANNMLTAEQLSEYSDVGIDHISAFFPDEDESQYFSDEIIKISNELGIVPSLLQFSLLSKSLSKDSWKYLGIPVPEYFKQANIASENKSSSSRLKHLFIKYGNHVIRLLAFYYNFKTGNLQHYDLSVFDITLDGSSSDERKTYIDQVFKVSSLGEILYSYFEQYYNRDYSNKDKYQVICSLFAACVSSNYNPVITLLDFFNHGFLHFYSAGINDEKNYKVELCNFLISINSRPEVILNKIDDKKFEAELILDKNRKSPILYCNGESSIIKKKTWEIGYNKVFQGTVDALSNPKAIINKEYFEFVIKRFCKISNLSLECPIRSIGILNAKNYPNINKTGYRLILSNIKSILTNTDYNLLIQRIKEINSQYYIFSDNELFRFNQALENSFEMSLLKTSSIQLNDSNIQDLYRFIVNPSFEVQRRYIESNITNIQNIPNLSFQVAKYFIDKDLYNYKYILYPSSDIIDYYQMKCQEKEKLDADRMGQLFGNSFHDTQIILLDSHKSVSQQIEALIDKMDIVDATIACGFVYKSGISLLRSTFNRFKESHIPVKIVVGSLQKFRSEDNTLITGIDRNTINELRMMMTNSNFDIYTCEERFYHGKIFMFNSAEKTVICFGSSNLSKAAFINNYELNMAFISAPDSDVAKMFKQWIEQLLFYSTKIENLDESKFCENEINHECGNLIRNVSFNQIRKQIEELSDEEVKLRLQLWMSYNPDIITTDLGILSLPNYYAFIYDSKKLLVLESFISGNSYFCISYSGNYETELKNISGLTKREIFEHSHMEKRGYHTRNRYTLERSIRNYFK